MAPFILKNVRRALITYSQCGNLDPFEVSNHFSNLGAECIVGRERHSDGGIHLHVFVDFGRQFSSRKTDVFDVGGCHPNIAKCGRTPWKAYDYAIKDGDVVAGGLERPDEESGDGSGSVDSTWHSILAAETPEEFWSLCHDLAPRDLARSFPSLQKYCDWRYRPVTRPYSTPAGYDFDTSCAPELDEWLPKSLVLYGDTRLGKTVWARSHGPHIYFCGLYSGAEAMKHDGADYAVFDDIQGGIKFFHGFKNWLGAQAEFQVKVLYKDPVLIQWGKPSIWLSNSDPRYDLSPSEVTWMEGNCLFVELTAPLFTSRASTE
ncbi:replication-associated protein [Pteropus associated gemycircularvirus 7]|uniref:Replication-associated protein n=1 Tax=Pteropus associated gemycircularvirus 7 TaxID=1985401 RepID=A0A140CTQ4_9VIRU|nr:replication-associated protein [Pteropus associated gemycircularvirus 7]AMH87711.1 replication-associated protein [Pteropus associated gemycircularvirus 7]